MPAAPPRSETYAEAAAVVLDEARRHNVPNLDALRDVRERCPVCTQAYRRIKRSKFTLEESAPLEAIHGFRFGPNPGELIAEFLCGGHGSWEVAYCVTA